MDQIDRTCYSNSLLRQPLIAVSITEELENPLYAGILNTLSNHCVGTVPLPVAISGRDNLNDAVEDKWMEWAVHNKIGSALREFRRKAASTGLAVLFPFRQETTHEIKLGFKVYGRNDLTSPSQTATDANIEDGVEFNRNNEVVAVWIKEDGNDEPTRYSSIEDDTTTTPVIVWSRKRIVDRWPECAPAFAIYPSIRRFMDNITKGEEMRTAIPMFLELDLAAYPADKTYVPDGTFTYEPGMVPTLPPGTKMAAFNAASVASDRSQFINLMASVAARCIDCPMNLALGDSSNHNMSSSMTDLQPWKYAVDIDRHDFEIVVRLVFNMWYTRAQLVPAYLPISSFSYPQLPVLFNYTVLFNHPDPVKCSSSRAQDLVSGASTLTRIYADQGRNARRELRKEARMLGITVQKLYELILTSRSKVAFQVLNGNQDSSTQVQETA